MLTYIHLTEEKMGNEREPKASELEEMLRFRYDWFLSHFVEGSQWLFRSGEKLFSFLVPVISDIAWMSQHCVTGSRSTSQDTGVTLRWLVDTKKASKWPCSLRSVVLLPMVPPHRASEGLLIAKRWCNVAVDEPVLLDPCDWSLMISRGVTPDRVCFSVANSSCC